MIICETKSKNKDNYNIHPLNEDNTIVNAYQIKGILFSNIEKCICKIIKKTKTVTGFFCEIQEKKLNY